jgi:hypothetical protein
MPLNHRTDTSRLGAQHRQAMVAEPDRQQELATGLAAIRNEAALAAGPEMRGVMRTLLPSLESAAISLV